MNSYSFDPYDTRNGGLEPKEVPCHRCYGTGEDDDGADCLGCLGMGTVIV